MCSARKLLNPTSMLGSRIADNKLLNPTSIVTNSSNRLVNPAGSLLAPKKSAATPLAQEASIMQAPQGQSLLGG